MDALRIHRNNRTLEVLAKIMNSYASKYDCSIEYNAEHNSLDFHGESIHKRTIAHETSALFNNI